MENPENNSKSENPVAGKNSGRKSLIFHLHPQKVKLGTLKFSRTFGLGGMAIVLIILQLITGILLRFHYEPLPGKAFESIITINNYILFGSFIRNIHHWSAVFLVIVSFLHLLRVFFTAAFYKPRQINWLIGIGLLFLVVLANFTGYLLPWDQLSYWAITVSTGILKYIPLIGDSLYQLIIMGNEVSGETLLFFYNLHTSLIPILLIFFMLFHFWRVRKAGGVIIPQEEQGKLVSTVPELVYREFITALVVIAVVLLFAALFNAPLLDKANPGLSPNPVKAPWYFAGLQELLLHFHPLFGGFIIPLLLVTFLIFLPYLGIGRVPDGQWFQSDKGLKTVIISAVSSIILTALLVVLDEYMNDLSLLFPGIPTEITNGLVPLLLLILIVWLYQLLMQRKFNTSSSEKIQAITVFIFTSFILMTIIGIFFRSENMALVLPF